MVKVDFSGIIATIEDMAWSCEDKQLEDILNSTLDPLGPSGADPDPNYTAAVDAIERLGGGKVIERDEVDYVDGAIY